MAEQFLNKAGTQIIANKIKAEIAARENLALQLNTLKGVAMTMYASESLLPSAIDFENGVVVAVGEIAWCVAEKTWHKVSAVNAETLAITWEDYDPHIQADIDLSKYSKNLIIDKASDITADQIAEYDTFDTTDNECGMVFGEVAEGDHNAVDGDTVYSALSGKVNTSDLTSAVTLGSTKPITSGGVYSGLLAPEYDKLTLNTTYIKQCPCISCKRGTVVSFHIDGYAGSNIPANTAITVATFPSSYNLNFIEVPITIDTVSIYARAWIHGNTVKVFLGEAYTSNVYIGGVGLMLG